ncbi:MAG: hypothetical protein HY234_07180 [Acidobacteria bacterium]|nr:hypothetical protein [Acidobacteriota bacterium]
MPGVIPSPDGIGTKDLSGFADLFCCKVLLVSILSFPFSVFARAVRLYGCLPAGVAPGFSPAFVEADLQIGPETNPSSAVCFAI